MSSGEPHPGLGGWQRGVGATTSDGGSGHLTRLTPEQQAAAEKVLSGKNLFLTGAAGTGKSFLLRHLVQTLKDRHGASRVAVTASTGIAAAPIGGQTIHSFSGVGLGKGRTQALLAKVKANEKARERWLATCVLVIDEVSMLDANLFESLEKIASSLVPDKAAGSSLTPVLPFGGRQLVLCGDFLQLPPVQERGEAPTKFCFQCTTWRRCELETVLLMQSVRQSDAALVSMLNEVRKGNLSAAAHAMAAQCHVTHKALPTDGIQPTKLYSLRKQVDADNRDELDKLAGEAWVYKAMDSFAESCSRWDRLALTQSAERVIPELVTMKVGAQVILVRNQPGFQLVNGSRGVVLGFEHGYPLVYFDNGWGCCIRECVMPQLHTVQIGKEEMTRRQVPLKLGWALTIHKAQGLADPVEEWSPQTPPRRARSQPKSSAKRRRLKDVAEMFCRDGSDDCATTLFDSESE